MPSCKYCGDETLLHYLGVPICVECDKAHKRDDELRRAAETTQPPKIGPQPEKRRSSGKEKEVRNRTAD